MYFETAGKHILPATVQQDIIAEMQLMVSQMHETYKVIFDSVSEEQNIVNISGMEMGSYLSNDESVFSDVFDSLDSGLQIEQDHSLYVCPTSTDGNCRSTW